MREPAFVVVGQRVINAELKERRYRVESPPLASRQMLHERRPKSAWRRANRPVSRLPVGQVSWS